MPIFKYTGERNKMNGVFGYDFSDHRAVNVPVVDEHAVRKLTNNGHFELIKGGETGHAETETTDDETFDFGVFKLKEDGTRYSRPDRTFDTEAEAGAYIATCDDGKRRAILRKEQR